MQKEDLIKDIFGRLNIKNQIKEKHMVFKYSPEEDELNEGDFIPFNMPIKALLSTKLELFKRKYSDQRD